MPEESQDREIRAKLTGWQVPLEAGDWELFVEEFLMPLSAPLSLDQAIKTSLSDLELEPTPSDWEAFSALMDDEFPRAAVLPLMGQGFSEEPLSSSLIEIEEETTFPEESLIRHKLEALHIDSLPDDWSQMASRLDGTPFDQAIREAIERISLPYFPEDWLDMSTKLDGPVYAQMRHQLSPYEVAFRNSDWKIFSRQWLGHKPWYFQWQNLVSVAAVVLLLLSIFIPLVSPGLRTSLQRTSLSIDFPSQSHQYPERVTESLTSSATAHAEGSSDKKPGLQDTDQHDKAWVAKGPANFNPWTGSKWTASITHNIPAEAENTVLDDAQTSAPINNPHEHSFESIQRIHHRNHSWSELAFPEKAPTWTQYFAPHKHFSSLAVGTYASWGRTRAELSSSLTSPGYVAGLRVELGLTEQVSIVTGLQYENREFSHRFFSYTPNGQNIENLIDAELQLVEIPLFARYYLPSSSDKIRIYGQAGVVAMVSLKEEYQLYQTRGELQPFPRTDNAGNLRLGNPAGGQKRSLETYAGNIFGGFGIDIKLAQNWFMQVEPYTLLSLQKTKGSGSLGVEKKMYHGGVGFSLMYKIK